MGRSPTIYHGWCSSRRFLSLRDIARQLAKKFPRTLRRAAQRAEEYARGMLTGGTLFEELDSAIVGPIDGHNIDTLVPILQNVRDAEQLGPILVHVVTEKGKGHPFSRPDKRNITLSAVSTARPAKSRRACQQTDLHLDLRAEPHS